MGRIFLAHPGGTRLFSCANCDTALTNRSELTSTVRLNQLNYLNSSGKIINIGHSFPYDLNSENNVLGQRLV